MGAIGARRQALPQPVVAWLVLAVVTLATRAWIFGNPVINIDEQFYLLVGDRMVHGVLPYVDIWDRKPVGLFLIYALAARVFANPVVGYQVMAALSVLLTSRVLFGMARQIAPFRAALAGAAAYPAWLLVFAGVGGQSPVFYNLPMALAAAWTLRLVVRHPAPAWAAQGCGIMLLAGLAIQIKPTTLFEGMWFGLTLLWLGWKQGDGWLLLGARGAGWIACALLPTGAAFAAFAAMGHAQAFVQGNFLSVFGDFYELLPALGRLAGLLLGIAPLLLCAWIVWRRRGEIEGAAPARLPWLFGWTAAAHAGFLIYGVFNDCYVLPLLMPLSVLAAGAIGIVARPRLLVALVLGLGLVGGGGRAAIEARMNGNGRQLEQLAALVRPALGHGCLYVNEDLPILYQVTRACLPTRFVFPQHLALKTYTHALGTDQLGELRRLLASHPSVIVISTTPDPYTLPASRQMLERALSRDYVPAGRATVGETVYAVFRLR